MKILLAVDGSNYTKRMLAYIAANDELLGPGHEYVVMTAITPISEYARAFLDVQAVKDSYRDEAQEVFRAVTAFAEQQRWNARTEYVVGHPPAAIAQFAEEMKADLIVMGAHGHGALGNLVLGSVASGVLSRCKVPVLLVR